MNFQAFSFRISSTDIEFLSENYQNLGFEVLSETAHLIQLSNKEILVELSDEWFESPTLVLYPTDVDSSFDELQDLGLVLDYQVDQWGNLEYQFFSPEGLRIIIGESLPKELPSCSDYQDFKELQIACVEFGDSVNFWHALGFQLAQVPKTTYPMTRLSHKGLTIGLHKHIDIKIHELIFH